MQVKVVARTVECANGFYKSGKNLKQDLKVFSGRVAGVCYMPDEYYSERMQDDTKALKRAEMTSKSGHHSVADHATISLLIEGIPKMAAMVLNSLQMYTTSEKSARYTLMQPLTDREGELYSKWKHIFELKIREEYSSSVVDDRLCEKLAQENARYMLSVFTPTTMVYTASLRQFNYIIGWIRKYINENGPTSNVDKRLLKALDELADKLGNTLGIDGIEDKNNRGLTLFDDCGYDNQYFYDTYRTNYYISLACLAQAQRHRTLRYRMDFDWDAHQFYIPKLIVGTDLDREWISDLDSISDCIPQATMVRVVETGHTADFFLKCSERLCGRAQLEIALNTEQTLIAMASNMDCLDVDIADKVSKYTHIDKSGCIAGSSKCLIDGYICKEVCKWGSKLALKRKI